MTTPRPQSDTAFLDGASDELRELMTSLAVEQELDKGEILFQQGDQGDALFAVVSGTLEVSVLSTDGRKLSLNVLRHGSVFGEICLFDPGVRTATVTSLEKSVVMGIRNADVMHALHDTPRLNIDLIQLAGKRLRWIGHQLNEQVFLPLQVRLARKILHLTNEDVEETEILAMSQADLAKFVGVSREAVSKTLCSWKAEGLIDLNRGGLVLRDRTSLTNIANLVDF